MTPKEPTFLDCYSDVLTGGPLLTAFAEANRLDAVRPGSGAAHLAALVGQDEITTGQLARAVWAHHHHNY